MRRRRRRRSSGRPRRRRYYRRNPSFGLKGLDLQSAALAVVGAAVAKMVVARLPIADSKIRAAATLGVGVAFNMVPGIPMGLRNKLSLGAQIAGVSALLSEFMPGVFAGVAEVSDVAMLSGPEDGMVSDDTDEYLLNGMGDPLEPELTATL